MSGYPRPSVTPRRLEAVEQVLRETFEDTTLDILDLTTRVRELLGVAPPHETKRTVSFPSMSLRRLKGVLLAVGQALAGVQGSRGYPLDDSHCAALFEEFNSKIRDALGFDPDAYRASCKARSQRCVAAYRAQAQAEGLSLSAARDPKKRQRILAERAEKEARPDWLDIRLRDQ